MPEIVGRARMPRLSSAPSSPTPGELYYDTVTNILYFWDGTTWVSTKSQSGTIYDTDQIGTVKSFAGTVIPTNWMLADGRTLNRGDYPQLADAMGVSAGATTFTLPDLRNKFIYGKNAPTDAISGGGAAVETLSLSQIPSHSHRADGAGGSGGQTVGADRSLDHLQNYPFGGGAFYGSNGNNWQPFATGGSVLLGWGATGAADRSLDHLHGVNPNGGGQSHNNLPPYILLAFIIKVTGVQVDSGGALVGATGPQGASGQTVDAYCQVPQGQNPQTACANGLWTQVLIPAVGASFVISKADGVNDDFVRNADGSVTIVKAGNYHLEACASEIATAWPDGASINFGLAKKNASAPTTSDWLVVGEYTSGSGTNNYPSCPVSCDVLCAAGDRVNCWLWHNSGASRNIALRNFSITRTGAGPIGPQGVTGPAGGQMALIEEKILAAQGIVSFQNIPQIYRHLWLIGNVKPTHNAGQGIALRFNNDSSTGYFAQGVCSTGSTAPTSEQWTNVAQARCGATFLTTEVASLEILIPNYRETATNRKQFHSRCLVYNGTNFDQRTYAGRYNPAGAITRIDLIGESNVNFEPGTKLCLYGII